jgi:hypothetical protein
MQEIVELIGAALRDIEVILKIIDLLRKKRKDVNRDHPRK